MKVAIRTDTTNSGQCIYALLVRGIRYHAALDLIGP